MCWRVSLRKTGLLLNEWGRSSVSRRKHNRLRHILKWVGVGMCVLILSTFIFTNIWHISRYGPRLVVQIHNAVITTAWHPQWPSDSRACWYMTNMLGFRATVPQKLGLRWSEVSWQNGEPIVVIPPWLALLFVAVPTAFLFWRDSRIPPGHCRKCGYNLMGNVSGRCPECGEACKPEAGAP